MSGVCTTFAWHVVNGLSNAFNNSSTVPPDVQEMCLLFYAQGWEQSEMPFGKEEIGESLSISSKDYSKMLSAVSFSTAGSPYK